MTDLAQALESLRGTPVAGLVPAYENLLAAAIGDDMDVLCRACQGYAEAAESLLEDVGVSLDPGARTLLERVREGTDAVSFLDEEGIHELAVTLLARDLVEAMEAYGEP